MSSFEEEGLFLIPDEVLSSANSTAAGNSSVLLHDEGDDSNAPGNCFVLRTTRAQLSLQLGAKVLVVASNLVPLVALVGFSRMMYRYVMLAVFKEYS